MPCGRGFSLKIPTRPPGTRLSATTCTFLEFEENGDPAQIGSDHKPLAQQQIDVLIAHLKKQKMAGRQNFVFAFIHGWRHDARIGDENIKNVRLIGGTPGELPGAAMPKEFQVLRRDRHRRLCRLARRARG